ncbi:DMT family transporter [Glutamicibacter sp. BSL13]
MHLGGVALGTVISLGSAPVLSGVLERIFDGHPLWARWWLAVAVGVAGSVLLCLARSAGDQAGQQQVVASVLLGLLAGASYALYSWVVGRLMGSGIERRAAVGSVFSAGGLLLMPVLLLTGAPLLASVVNTWVGLYLSLVPMFLGYVLFGVGLSRVNASTATTITLLEPAVAAVLAVLIVGEHLGVVGWLGVVLIGLALGVLVYSPRRITAQGRPRGPARSSGGGSNAQPPGRCSNIAFLCTTLADEPGAAGARGVDFWRKNAQQYRGWSPGGAAVRRRGPGGPAEPFGAVPTARAAAAWRNRSGVPDDGAGAYSGLRPAGGPGLPQEHAHPWKRGVPGPL